MVLSREQTETLITRLNDMWGQDHQCGMCGRREWSVSDRIFELREFHQGNLVVGGDSRVFPVIPVTCSHCGNTIFINAISVGILAVNPVAQQGGQR